jgi:hypothetical protein
MGVLAALGWSVPASAGPDADARVQESLAVLNAGGGSFMETDAGYRLTLERVPPRAVWFEDHPGRGTGSFSIKDLEEAFFDGELPNAALEVFAGRSAGDVVIVEISNPRYQPRRSRLVLDATVLSDDAVRAARLEDHRQRATTSVPEKFGPAALFIDDSCVGANGEVVFGLQNITCTDAAAVADAWIDAGMPSSIDVGGTEWAVSVEDFITFDATRASFAIPD